jgi:hypothetical protein
MGSQQRVDEQPVHRVNIMQPFYLSQIPLIFRCPDQAVKP